jgi:outer membrane protein
MMSWALALVLTAGSASAQTAAPEIRKLSLEECIAIALEHNFGVQIARYEPRVARYQLAGLYGAYEPSLFMSGQHEYTRNGGGVDSNGQLFLGSDLDANILNGGISGILPWGTAYNLGVSATDTWGTKPGVISDPTNPTGFTTNVFTDTLGNPVVLISTNFGTLPANFPFESSSAQAGALTLSQPLLRNFWIDSTRYQIYASKKNVKSSEETFRGQLMTTITSVESAYFNLVSAEDFVRVQEKALELADQLLTENRKRVEVGAMAPLDEKQAQSQAAASRADLLSAQALRDTAQRVLKNILSESYTNEWANVIIAPRDILLAIPQTYDLQESWRKGLANSPALIAARLGLDVAKYNIRLQRNQLFPQLDVFGSYGYNGSGKEFSDALNQVQSRDNNFWSFGAQFSIPLGQRSARNNLKTAKASKEQTELQLRQLEQGVLITIENDIGLAKANFEKVDATRQARLYAEAALEAEQKKLENGKSTSFVVLQLQRDLTQARADEIVALVQYNISLAQLAFDEGSTLERRHVSLNVQSLETTLLDGK